MREENETKLGLTAEEVEENRETEFGLSGLFRGVGDAECDPIALAHSKEGLLMQEYMAVMGLGEDTDESRDYWANYGKGLRKETRPMCTANGLPIFRLPLSKMQHGVFH